MCATFLLALSLAAYYRDPPPSGFVPIVCVFGALILSPVFKVGWDIVPKEDSDRTCPLARAGLGSKLFLKLLS